MFIEVTQEEADALLAVMAKHKLPLVAETAEALNYWCTHQNLLSRGFGLMWRTLDSGEVWVGVPAAGGKISVVAKFVGMDEAEKWRDAVEWM